MRAQSDRCLQTVSCGYVALIASGQHSVVIFTALHGMQMQMRMWMRSGDEKSVCLSVCLLNVWIVTKRKKDLSRFLCHTKGHLAFLSEKNGCWEQPLLPEILGQPAPFGAISPILN